MADPIAMVHSSRSATRDGRSSDTTPHYTRPLPPKEWSLLFYLCGDHDDVEGCIEKNLRQLASVGSSDRMHIVVQRDRPAARGGAERFVLRGQLPVDGKLNADLTLGAVDTGTHQALTDFLTWALRVCPSRRVALVIGGMGVFEPGSVSAAFGRRRSQLFSFCDDASSGSALDLVDLDRALRDSSKALPNGKKTF